MWSRSLEFFCCPLCRQSLTILPFRESSETIAAEHAASADRLGIPEGELPRWVDAGLLLCDTCRTCFPIWRGLPVLLPYRTQVHREFSREFEPELAALPGKSEFANQEPVPGERFVLESFSKEWLEYDYDGVIWTANYEDYEKTFLTEVGFQPDESGLRYLEVGCGIGITASIAQKAFRGDAVGVDLSLAALKATAQWKSNPFLHFVEASAFHLPLKEGVFDVVYSRGVLHHTYSTEEAFKRVATRCRPGGRTYLWVYGTGSIGQNLFRRAAYALERLVRPALSRHPGSPLTTACLAALSTGYIAFNGLRRLRNQSMQPYNFRRAMHAARDRFTPEFAHRHDPQEVLRWFREAGFDRSELLDWQQMPTAEQENFERNVGVRGWRSPNEVPELAGVVGRIEQES